MNLPEDIVFQILSWLPSQSLIKFKSVCKSWLTLLKDQSFISQHTKNMGRNAHLLICCRNNITNKRIIAISADYSLETFIYQDLPPSFGHVRIIGPCNGIICLYGYPDHVVLCNPSTREIKTLLRSPIPRPSDGRFRGGDVGFGFDPIMNDYKVIQILFCVSNQRSCVYHVEIYSLSTDSWKKYDASVPANIMYINVWITVYQNGTLFCWWAQSYDQVEVILYFDFSKEVFKEMPLPSGIDVLGGNKRTTRAIIQWNDSIAVVVYQIKEIEKVFDIWLVNELGSDNWTKLMRIGPISGVERPLGFWENGEFIILENSSRELVLFDVKTKRIRNLGLHVKRDRLEVLVYYDSLVSLHTFAVS